MNNHTATSGSVAEFYDGYYSESEPSEWRILGGRDKGGRLVQLCSDVPHQTVLEVGAGDGSVIADLAQRGFGERLTAVEISDTGLALLKNRSIPRLEAAHKFDGYHLPFEDNSFDLAYAVHVLEHVEHERIFLREAARVASVLYIEVPLEATVRVSRAIDNDIGHINFYNRHILRGLLE